MLVAEKAAGDSTVCVSVTVTRQESTVIQTAGDVPVAETATEFQMAACAAFELVRAIEGIESRSSKTVPEVAVPGRLKPVKVRVEPVTEIVAVPEVGVEGMPVVIVVPERSVSVESAASLALEFPVGVVFTVESTTSFTPAVSVSNRTVWSVVEPVLSTIRSRQIG